MRWFIWMLVVSITLFIPLKVLADGLYFKNSGRTYRFYKPRPYKDVWGNRYSNPSNLWRDLDGDGLPGYLDYNDRNPYIQTPYQRGINRSYNYWGY